MCKNIHTTVNVFSFTSALSKIHNDCSFPIISSWISTNESRLYSFSHHHGNWLSSGVTVWNLAGETLINLHSSVSWRWTWYWGSCNTKNWIHHNSRLCVWVCVHIRWGNFKQRDKADVGEMNLLRPHRKGFKD